MNAVRSETPAVLAGRGLSKRFGGTQAVRDAAIEVAEDELVVVVGPTGAGKTTLLRLLTGLEEPDGGGVWMRGREVTRLPTAERDLAMVFQNFSLYPRWSVRENLEFPLRAPGRQLPDQERKRRIDWAAQLLKLTHLLDRPAPRLSGGEMQRVAIGRAIVRQPAAYLMDEPLTNLDAKLRETLRAELVELRRRMQRPMLYVTHDPAEALSMADRIVVFANGSVQQAGTPREVYERPASPLVALQLGQPKINLLRVQRREGSWCVDDGTPVIRESDPELIVPSGLPIRSPATLGVRPEHLGLCPLRGLVGERPALKGEVRLTEYLGASTTVVLSALGLELRCQVEGACSARVGETVGIAVKRGLLWPAAD